MNYDKDLDMIIYDHLVSESNEPGNAYTMVPDGDYQGFKWQNGKWGKSFSRNAVITSLL